MTTAAVQAVGLSVRRGGGLGLPGRRDRLDVLRDCGFRIPRGAVCGLVGPNGAGKSALLATVAGLIAPSSGTLELWGRPVGDEAHRARLAYVAQNRSLYPQFSVRRLLRLGRDLNPCWQSEAAEEVLEAARIPLRARVGSLSGGHRTLLSLALARGKAADLLLLDEPLADLDPLARRRTMGLLLADVADRGATLVLSSHVLADLEESIDHLLLLDQGRVRLAGALPELLAAHRLLDAIELPARRAAAAHPVDAAQSAGAPFSGASDTPAVVESRGSGPARSVLVRLHHSAEASGAGTAAGEPPTLEELVLAYLRRPDAPGWISPGMRPLTADAPEGIGA
ncbi:ABC transporter ATP-binding protein [Streptacidiphilus sp. NEAU-YB345]|uniref:ABC transporter ATP-binding protein n=1 Tax=Streptacidiphilus fuscans TaxID=2789292 RepID=A0A931B120_9ACTN|nr:ABC transporter ATP-binding protein [Streptacidiphilus fuscans]